MHRITRHLTSVTVKVNGNLDCNDGELLHRWACEGLGLGWRSTWEIQSELASGRLITVLDEYALDNYDIMAVYPQQRHLPAKIRFYRYAEGGVCSARQ